jgi:LPXTG-site transpeptidase (sortase) family protein
MSDHVFVGLDNPAFRGRLRQNNLTNSYSGPRANRRYINSTSVRNGVSINDVLVTKKVRHEQTNPQKQLEFRKSNPPINTKQKTPNPLRIVRPQPFAEPAKTRLQPSSVLKRHTVRFPKRKNKESSRVHFRLSKLQYSLVGMAVIVFVLGVASSIQTIRTNHNASSQVAALAQKANNSDSSGTVVVPSTKKPSIQAFSEYSVAFDLPRYIKISKIGVKARVLQVGINSNGALGAPNNIFDAAWYTGSSKPGQPGATLIDGHVSSWASHGVFYRLKNLVAGDSIQIVRGDGSLVNYQVVRTQIYGVNSVDMQAAINPVTEGKSGLNLITCTGDVIKGTNEFSNRIIVFAQQV